MASAIEIFTAVAATFGAAGAVGTFVEIYRDRTGISVEPSVEYIPGISAYEANLRIEAICLRRPVTLTYVAVDFSNGFPIAQPIQPVRLEEGDTHAFHFGIGRLRNEYEKGLIGEPIRVMVKANGRVFTSRLSQNEIIHITGNQPSDLRWLPRKLWQKAPWYKKRRERQRAMLQDFIDRQKAATRRGKEET